jgi:AcrR family transcriptional regulator
VTQAKTTRLPPGERRGQLVALGLELLGQTPHDQVSIEAIARAAGISKGLLYHYFPTKDDFVVAVLRRSHEELERRMAPDLGADLPAGARLDASLDAFLGYAEEHATGFLAVTHARAGGGPAIRAVLEEQRAARVDSMVAFAAALAGASREDVASPGLALVLEGWLHFTDGVVATWLAGDRELSRAQVGHLLRENLLSALASVAGVDDRAAPARLARGAAALRATPAPAPAPA